MIISLPFLSHAADILADTTRGLSGGDIVKEFNLYAVEYNVNIPYPTYPFDAPNKRTAFLDNLRSFTPALQYKIIKELCEHLNFALKQNDGLKNLKLTLVTQYGHLAIKDELSKLDESLPEATRHWLENVPNALELYLQAIEKYKHGLYSRNLLNDLQLKSERRPHGEKKRASAD